MSREAHCHQWDGKKQKQIYNEQLPQYNDFKITTVSQNNDLVSQNNVSGSQHNNLASKNKYIVYENNDLASQNNEKLSQNWHRPMRMHKSIQIS